MFVLCSKGKKEKSKLWFRWASLGLVFRVVAGLMFSLGMLVCLCLRWGTVVGDVWMRYLGKGTSEIRSVGGFWRG